MRGPWRGDQFLVLVGVCLKICKALGIPHHREHETVSGHLVIAFVGDQVVFFFNDFEELKIELREVFGYFRVPNCPHYVVVIFYKNPCHLQGRGLRDSIFEKYYWF
jgi:hypothetical protein